MAFDSESASKAGKNSSRKGKGNKDLEPIREAFRDFVEHNIKNVQENFDKLGSKDKLFFILNFAEYCIPKLQRTELGGIGGTAIPITINKTYEKEGDEKKFNEQ